MMLQSPIINYNSLMTSGYKPKFIEALMREREDSVPELVDISQTPEKDESMHEMSWRFKNQNTKRQKRLDVSSYRHENLRKDNKQELIYIEDQYQKTSKRQNSQMSEILMALQDQKRKNSLYQQKVDQLQNMIDTANIHNKQLDKRVLDLQRINHQLKFCKENLEKQIRQIRLHQTPHLYSSVQSDKSLVNRTQFLQKLEIYLKKLVQNFIDKLKPERISKNVQKRISQFLQDILQVPNVPIQKMTFSKSPGISKYKQSYAQSPIANETSYVQIKNSFQDSPFQSAKEKQREMFIQRMKYKEMQSEKEDRRLPRFNFIKQSVDPSITQQSAFMSISNIGREGLDKSYDAKGRSRSQRRRKIFQN